MCIACTPALDHQKHDAFGEKLLTTLNHGMTSLMISIGHRTGLFDVMSDAKARTSDQLAQDAGLNERYVREWSGSMTAARIFNYDSETKTYQLPLEHAAWLCRSAPTSNMAIFAQYIAELGSVEDRIVQCFKQGGGVPYEAYKRFHDIMEEDSGQSIVPIIIEQVIPLFPQLHERLTQGINVLDVGCGRGNAIIRLAQHYPASQFTGYDLSEPALNHARQNAQALGLANIQFIQKDLTHWHEPDTFDWITALDAIHDQARPDNVLAAIHTALRNDGVFFMLDIDANSDPQGNIDHPLGQLLYGISCLHCMTVSLAQGGMGLGAVWGTQLARQMLQEAGFENINIHRFEHDVQNAYYFMQKQPQHATH